MLKRIHKGLISPFKWFVFIGIAIPIQACATDAETFFDGGWINIKEIPREVSSVVFYDAENRPIQALGRDYHEGMMQKGEKCKFPPRDISAKRLKEAQASEESGVCVGLYNGVYDKPFATTIQAEHHGSHRCRIYIPIAADYAIEVPRGCGRAGH